MRPPNREPSWFGCQCMGCLSLASIAAILTSCMVIALGDVDLYPEDTSDDDWLKWMFWGLVVTYAIIGGSIWLLWRGQRLQ